MPVAVAEMYDTLTAAEQKEVGDFISFIISRREAEKSVEPPSHPRIFGSLEGKMSAKFSDDWEMSDEEFLG